MGGVRFRREDYVEDWERMSKWLLGIADRLEYGIGFRREDSMIAI